LTFIQREYQKPRPEWDHDHCEICFAKFMEEAACLEPHSQEDNIQEILHNGFNSIDNYRWICPRCFQENREQYRWNLVRRE
jgi:hypothetical protein